MNTDKENLNNIIEKTIVEYDTQKSDFKGIDRETFDFDAEFAKGLTLEEVKVESIRRIREWWVDNFDVEFENGLTPEDFKLEMAKRIREYPWKK